MEQAVFNIEIRKMEIINYNLIKGRILIMIETKNRESANNEKNNININNNRNFNKPSKFIILHNNKNLWVFFIKTSKF